MNSSFVHTEYAVESAMYIFYLMWMYYLCVCTGSDGFCLEGRAHEYSWLFCTSNLGSFPNLFISLRKY